MISLSCHESEYRFQKLNANLKKTIPTLESKKSKTPHYFKSVSEKLKIFFQELLNVRPIYNSVCK